MPVESNPELRDARLRMRTMRRLLREIAEHTKKISSMIIEVNKIEQHILRCDDDVEEIVHFRLKRLFDLFDVIVGQIVVLIGEFDRFNEQPA